ncbi:hypothetical protein BB559_000922 [Furculomyces boomerangus]|uniref:Adhesin domain-containing protein n=1 Tax=Furculomyces boomerangus TaxID=61424 RepID=A0A2T9Z3P9_9FUNG|nr:hypothetical protein BB559_000922 [Furculomyces boomerangus]
METLDNKVYLLNNENFDPVPLDTRDNKKHSRKSKILAFVLGYLALFAASYYVFFIKGYMGFSCSKKHGSSSNKNIKHHSSYYRDGNTPSARIYKGKLNFNKRDDNLSQTQKLDPNQYIRLNIITELDVNVTASFGYKDNDEKTIDFGYSAVQGSNPDYAIKPEFIPNDRQGMSFYINPVNNSTGNIGFMDNGSQVQVKILVPKGLKNLTNFVTTIVNGQVSFEKRPKDSEFLIDFVYIMANKSILLLNDMMASRATIINQNSPIIASLNVIDQMSLSTITGDIFSYFTLPGSDHQVQVDATSKSGNIYLNTLGSNYTGAFDVQSLAYTNNSAAVLVKNVSNAGQITETISTNYGKQGLYKSNTSSVNPASSNSTIKIANNQGSVKMVFL